MGARWTRVAAVAAVLLAACGGAEEGAEGPVPAVASPADPAGETGPTEGGGPTGASPSPQTPADGPGQVTYVGPDGEVHRVAARAGATPQNISAALDRLSPGEEAWLSVSRDGEWLLLETSRFGCESTGACLAVVPADLSEGRPVIVGDRPVFSFGISAIASGGSTIVFPATGGPHEVDLWATDLAGGDRWGEPRLLTGDSPHAHHEEPRLSAGGDRVVFHCGPRPYGAEGSALCEVGTDGASFATVVRPEDGPGGSPANALRSADLLEDGSLVFEADWGGGELVWRLGPDGGTPSPVNPSLTNDNSPCALPGGRVASLWLGRPDGDGIHELKVMTVGGDHEMVVTGLDLQDVGLSCGRGGG